MPKLNSIALFGAITSVKLPVMDVSVQVAVTASKVRRRNGTLPAMASCPSGALAEGTGAIVTVLTAALRLRNRNVTTEPVRPKSTPELLVGLISIGA